MSIADKLQKAITLAIENHPGLEKKAFRKGADGNWIYRENVVHQYYSSTEAILVGTLLEMFHHIHGLPGINFDYKNNSTRPSESICPGATSAAKLFTRLDVPQRQIIKTLL